MNVIQNNPYRIAGILSNATGRELQRQKGKISKYVNIGKEVTSELDFSFLQNVRRTESILNKAFSGIEQSQDKVNNSLFWFIKVNSFDETAINYLINGDKEKAIEIWEKVTGGKEVTQKNFSSFNNIGTLKLLSNSESEIKEGIEAKIKLIESTSFKDFVHTVADETFTIDNDKQAKKLIDELLMQFKSQYSHAETLKLFSNCNGFTQKYLTQKFTEEPIHKIEREIESTQNKRKENKRRAYEFGLKLVVDCKDDLSLLKSLLGIKDLKYKMIADKLAKEVMQCGIDYFQKLKDTTDPSEKGLKLLKYAQLIAVGTQTKDRAKENIEGMLEWAKNAPIKEDIEYIASKIKSFQTQSDSIDNSKALINNCKGRLQNIRKVLGSTDEFYLSISSAVVSNALGMVIEVVNGAQKGLEYNRAQILLLPEIFSNAVSAVEVMGSLDMDNKTRLRYIENKTTINSLNSQIENVRKQAQAASSSSSNNGGGGCYIATMVYGDYDHPQVIELRKFRDEFLRKSILGRSFIKTYYKYAPGLVEKLKDRKGINNLIRHSLDHFIKAIRKK
jgi:hypothetical protein